jgi:thioredoxin reductase (NADPH)
VHRRDAFKAERILQNRLFAHPKVEVVWNHVVDEVVGENEPRGVTAVRLRDVTTGAVTERAVHGLFVAIGHAPAVELFQDQLRLKPSGLSVGRARHHAHLARGACSRPVTSPTTSTVRR